MEMANKIIEFFLEIYCKMTQVKSTPKTLLIIRMDAIGDYILFRNFLKEIRESEKFRDYEITLCGNKDWKDLSLELDSEYFDHSIWLDYYKFKNDKYYRYLKIRDIRKKGFETIIHPVFSRLYYWDLLVGLSRAKNRVGSFGDTTNQKEELKDKSDSFYTSLIPASSEVLFEFYRNREFFENILNKSLKHMKPRINYRSKTDIELPEEYIIIFPGKKQPNRRWPQEKFASLINYIYEKFKVVSVISGGPGDREISENICKMVEKKESVVDFAGKTSLVDLIHIIKKTRLLISNDTSAVHIAASLEKPAICISNGLHLFRFDSYPPELCNCIHTIYPEDIERNIQNRDYVINLFYNKKKLDINTISLERVISEIENNHKYLLI